jgi:tetratricopeptide (TPR) repeat protein
METASKLRDALTSALTTVPFMSAMSDRRLLIHLVRSELHDFPDVQEHDEARLHVVRIVMVCHGHPGGLRALRSALNTMAPDAAGTQGVSGLLDRAALRAILPENAAKRGYDLVRRACEAGLASGWRGAVQERESDAAVSDDPVAFLKELLVKGEGGIDSPSALAFVAGLAEYADGLVADQMHQWHDDQLRWLGLPSEPRPQPTSGEVRGAPDNERQGIEDTAPVEKVAADPRDGPPQDARPDVITTLDAHSPGLGSGSVDSEIEGDPTAAPGGPVYPPAGDSMASAPTTDHSVEQLPQVWGNVPPRNPNFVGREELLSQLHAQLNKVRETAVLPQALRGMGGVGKSQLAIEYVHQHSREYDLIWWISAEQEGQILAGLTDLAQRLNLDTSAEANVAVPMVRDALSTGQTGYRNWLLIFDNAENLREVRHYFPTGGAGKILVTSRNPEWERVARTLEVDVFTRDESTRFLTAQAPELSLPDAERLAEVLGDLPLAVEQAAAWRSATGMAVDEYLQLLAAKQINKRMELLGSMPSGEYGLSVAAAWDMSFDSLQSKNPAALQILQICSFFAPEPISRDLFTASAAAPITPELDETLGDPIRLARAIRDIQRYALARFDHRSNTLQMHRLIQQVLVGRMDEQQRTVMRESAHTLLANANPGNPNLSDQWRRYQALRPHLVKSEAVSSADRRVRQLVFGMVQFLYYWGDHEGCENLAGDAYRNWREGLEEHDGQLLALSRFLAHIKWVNGKYAEAQQLNERTLDVYRNEFGDEDEGTLNAMSNLAKSLRASGDFDQALTLDQAAFETARRQFGADDPATLALAHNLGVSLRVHAEFARSRALDDDTYRRRRAVIGWRNPETFRTRICLGIDQRESGDYLGARTFLEETYQDSVQQFGPDAPIAVFAARTLAVARRKAGDHERARELSEDTLLRLTRRYSDDYPDTIATNLNLAIDLRHSGDIASAIQRGENAVQLYVGTFGEDHPHALAAWVNLAVALRLNGDVAKALDINRRCFELLRAVLSEEHATTLICATNLASDLYALEKFQDAYELDIDTLQRSSRMMGESHPSTLACSANLALDLRGLDRLQESDKIQSDTMVAYRRVLGERHPATLNALQSLRADGDIDPIPL